MALTPACPVLPDLNLGHEATCAQAISDSADVLVNKFSWKRIRFGEIFQVTVSKLVRHRPLTRPIEVW